MCVGHDEQAVDTVSKRQQLEEARMMENIKKIKVCVCVCVRWRGLAGVGVSGSCNDVTTGALLVPLNTAHARERHLLPEAQPQGQDHEAHPAHRGR